MTDLQTNIDKKRIILAGDSWIAWNSVIDRVIENPPYVRAGHVEDFLQSRGHLVARVALGGSTNLTQLKWVKALLNLEPWDLIVFGWTDEYRDLTNRDPQTFDNNAVLGLLNHREEMSAALANIETPVLFVDGLCRTPFKNSKKIQVVRSWRERIYRSAHELDLTGITSYDSKTIGFRKDHRFIKTDPAWYDVQTARITKLYREMAVDPQLAHNFPDMGHPRTTLYETLHPELVTAASNLGVQI